MNALRTTVRLDNFALVASFSLRYGGRVGSGIAGIENPHHLEESAMSDRFVASTQYTDLKGTIALDGYEGAPLFDMAELTDMPKKGYFPVGLSFFTVHVTDGTVPFSVVAVRVSEAGANVDEMAKYAATHEGVLPVYSFNGRIKPELLESLFKRASVKVILRHLEPFSIEVREVEE